MQPFETDTDSFEFDNLVTQACGPFSFYVGIHRYTCYAIDHDYEERTIASASEYLRKIV